MAVLGGLTNCDILTGRGAIKPNAFNKGAMNMGEFDESNSE
jgi:hypothetical protein